MEHKEKGSFFNSTSDLLHWKEHVSMLVSKTQLQFVHKRKQMSKLNLKFISFEIFDLDEHRVIDVAKCRFVSALFSSP